MACRIMGWSYQDLMDTPKSVYDRVLQNIAKEHRSSETDHDQGHAEGQRKPTGRRRRR